jgi:hypothetical protein
VLSGVRTPPPITNLSEDETRLLGTFRSLSASDQAALWYLAERLLGDAS